MCKLQGTKKRSLEYKKKKTKLKNGLDPPGTDYLVQKSS